MRPPRPRFPRPIAASPAGVTLSKSRPRLQAQTHGQRDGERTRRSRRRCRAPRPPKPDDGGYHPRDPRARDQGDHRLLSSLPNLRRPRRRFVGSRPARHRLGGQASAQIRAGRPASAFDFLESLLVGKTKQSGAKIGRTAALRFAMKLQQFSGPVMAKGVEDTAFYRYNRFVALNEVGGAPERFGIAPSLFHKANAQRAEQWPRASSRPPRTTRSAARTPARGSPCCRKSRMNGGVRSGAGAGSFGRGSATSKAARRPTATTNTCSIRCWLARGRWTCSTVRRPRGWTPIIAVSVSRREVAARGQATLELDVTQPRLRSGDARLHPGGAEAGGGLPDELPAFVERIAQSACRTASFRPEADGAGHPRPLPGLQLGPEPRPGAKRPPFEDT